MRTKRSIEGVGDTEYVYEGGQLLQMQYLYYIFDFSYGADGRAVGFSVTNTDDMSKSFFYYALNSRGDVIALYNSAGTKICTYSYDAYGKLLNTSLFSNTSIDRIASNFNPLRYRSYVYDRETGLYYLQTRYYDPTTCRFVNEDNNFSNINLFMYCGNNPIVYFDPTGESYAKDCPGGFGGFSPCFSGGYGSGGGGGGVASTPVTVQYLRVVRPALTVGALSSLTFFVGTTFLLSDVDAMRQEKIERKIELKIELKIERK